MDKDKVKALVGRVRNNKVTSPQKQQINDLADDLLGEYSNQEDLDKRFLLFIALLGKINL